MEALQDDSGNWAEDASQLKASAVNFYAMLFQAEVTSGGEFLVGHFLRLSQQCIRHLEAAYSMEETRKALMSMGPLRAPGPDGFQPIFFQRT